MPRHHADPIPDDDCEPSMFMTPYDVVELRRRAAEPEPSPLQREAEAANPGREGNQRRLRELAAHRARVSESIDYATTKPEGDAETEAAV